MGVRCLRGSASRWRGEAIPTVRKYGSSVDAGPITCRAPSLCRLQPANVVAVVVSSTPECIVQLHALCDLALVTRLRRGKSTPARGPQTAELHGCPI